MMLYLIYFMKFMLILWDNYTLKIVPGTGNPRDMCRDMFGRHGANIA